MPRHQPTANDYALAWLRICVGILFLIFAEYKVFGRGFIYEGGFENWIHQFLSGGVYPFMAPVLRDFVLPHAHWISLIVSFGELCIGLGLLFGILVRLASFFGFAYMALLILASNYPGLHAPWWEYFGAALNHLVLALCFLAFAMANAARVWSLGSFLDRKYRPRAAADEVAFQPRSSNVFNK